MKRLQVLRAALVGGASMMTLAHPAIAKEFNVPGGDLAVALDAYMQQAGVQIVYSDDAVRGHRSRGAKGDLTEVAALTQVLRGSGFTAQSTATQTIGIVPAADQVELAQVTPPRAAATPAASSVETVVVTAQHKAEDIQQVPIAVTALSQKDLTDRQIAAGPDLLRDVPNMNFTKTNFSGYDIELRGIGTQAISVTTDPAVAVAFNDTPFIRNHFFEQEFFDLQDVEVLLGPQGTLYGRNATAGVVNLKSALPTDTYEAMLSADIGNYNNRRLEGMINIPIVGDKLDIRFAGEWTKRDGYTTDTDYNSPVDGRDLWSGRLTIGWNPTSNFHSDLIWEHFSEDDDRLRSGKQLCETAQPVSNISGQVGNYAFDVPVPPAGSRVGFGGGAGALTLDQNYTSQGCQATSLYAPTAFQVPYGPSLPYVIGLAAQGIISGGFDPYAATTQSTNLRQIQSALLPTYRAKNDTLEFNATYSVTPTLTLTSETGYNQDFLWSTEDYNRFDTAPGLFGGTTGLGFGNSSPGSVGGYFLPPNASSGGGYIFCDPQLGCSGSLISEDLDVEHAWQASQEFRLTSNFGGPFNFSLGGNYLHYETEESYYVFSNALTAFARTSGDEETIGNPGGNGTPNCLITYGKSAGYQSVNPINGGGSPTFTCDYVDPNPIGSLNNQGHNYFLSQNPYTLNSYALFGEAYYNITPALKLTTGLRWTVDQKHFIDIPSEVLTQGYGYSVSGVENQVWERPTGRAVLDWTPQLDFTDQTLLYASYSHGYKAGGANPPGAIFGTFQSGPNSGQVAFVDHPQTFKPEYIEAFELGTKNTLLDGSLTLNGDIFYYNYTGYQISEIVDRTAINNNYNAHVEGAEVTANWEPLPGLKFNFAGGWEDTAAAGGDTGIDLMDRTAGTSGWMVLKPFVTQASNCILPNYVVAALLQERVNAVEPGAPGGVAENACGVAYVEHLDPVTALPYGAPNPTGVSNPGFPGGGNGLGFSAYIPPGYPGFNPMNPAYNNGEGFSKNLAGHALPNAPPLTVSFGGEYSLPVNEDWIATLRGDFYWQADSWARIFNDNPYDRIDGYTNVNVALILTSANGWQVMGYVKNVFNTTAITGDFLNSDDSGLTTNVFLTDPRLYGIRVTKHLDEGDGFWGKEWSGADWINDIFADADNGKPSLWIELGGQLEHISGQGAAYSPAFLSTYSTSSVLQEKTTPLQAQKPPIFSAGEEAAISYQPDDSEWVIAASVRYGRSGNKMRVHHQTDNPLPPTYQAGKPVPRTPGFYTGQAPTPEKFVSTQVYHQESHSIIDFMAGKDLGLGLFGQDLSTVLNVGVRFAQFTSHSSVDMRARPDRHFKYYPSSHAPTRAPGAHPSFHTYHAYENAARKFQGVGPSLSWTGSMPVSGEQGNGIDFDWGANGALLFGRQKTVVRHQESGRFFTKSPEGFCSNPHATIPCYNVVYQHGGGHTSNRAVVVPNLGGFAGISYRYQNAKISFGYRADVFFGAMEGGIDKRHSETLNMGGPFATISFGLGG